MYPSRSDAVRDAIHRFVARLPLEISSSGGESRLRRYSARRWMVQRFRCRNPIEGPAGRLASEIKVRGCPRIAEGHRLRPRFRKVRRSAWGAALHTPGE